MFKLFNKKEREIRELFKDYIAGDMNLDRTDIPELPLVPIEFLLFQSRTTPQEEGIDTGIEIMLAHGGTILTILPPFVFSCFGHPAVFGRNPKGFPPNGMIGRRRFSDGPR